MAAVTFPAVSGSWSKANMSAAAWKRHIIRQLKHRDRTQKYMYQDLIKSYNKLLERTKIFDPLNERLQVEFLNIFSDHLNRLDVTSTVHRLEDPETLQLQHQKEVTKLEKTNGELAVQIYELGQNLQIKQKELEELQSRLKGVEGFFSGVVKRNVELHESVKKITCENTNIKQRYDELLKQHRTKEEELQKITNDLSEATAGIVKLKSLQADDMNNDNDRECQARWAKQLASAAAKVIDTTPKTVQCNEDTANTDEAPAVIRRAFRSASATFLSPIFTLKENILYKMRRVESLCDDFKGPSFVCWSSRLPTKALEIVEAHESDINAAKFSSISQTLATGGDDRIIKLWDVVAGRLESRTSLQRSSSGITSIEFDPTGYRILAASYEGAVHLWEVNACRPTYVLTGHRHKVTAAKFKSLYHQAVTGSFDRTLKIWDLNRGACTDTIQVSSYCSDVVSLEFLVISGHHDKKIRFWDCRTKVCTNEIPVEGRVTSLNVTCDHSQLLSCSRDDTLKVVDLRKMNCCRQTFRADGFKCGSDITKAIFSPDGSFVTAGSADGTLFVWNVKTGKLEASLAGQHNSCVNAVTWSTSGEYVVSVDRGKKAVLWSDY
ncbi:protein Atg16l2-like isoform X2 [Protopterus annectens]|uniref:protein Atg16l2-like isoform X2 n=1 Tax=Protopterus annectens TaxID=7888 RepID=UPI001CFA0629|nr:protein Atg16l2-like isoform X2 [Protopterus annectens]